MAKTAATPAAPKGLPEATYLQVRLTLLTEMLGTAPQDEAIYTQYIATRAEDPAKGSEEVLAIKRARAAVNAVQDHAESIAEQLDCDLEEDGGFEGLAEEALKGLTVHARDEDQNLIIYDYQLKGFIKEAAASLVRITGTECEKQKTAIRKVLSGLIFVNPRECRITLPAGATTSYCARPIRVEGPKGERVAIVVSESVPAGSTIECTIECLKEENVKMLKEILNYGSRKGLLQWRNGGKGRFSHEILSETKKRPW